MLVGKFDVLENDVKRTASVNKRPYPDTVMKKIR
jgi:hypothetical protein